MDLILIGCDPEILNDPDRLKEIMDRACTIAGAEVKGCIFHKFDPVGVTLVNVLAESDLTVHTFPKKEEGQAAVISLFTCGEKADPEAPIAFLREKLKATRIFRSPLTIFNPDLPDWQEI